jgi:hypothetical protein
VSWLILSPGFGFIKHQSVSTHSERINKGDTDVDIGKAIKLSQSVWESKWKDWP